MTSTNIRVNKIATVIIPVSDQDGAIGFYVNLLAFTERVDVPFGNGYRWVEVAPGDHVTTIALAPPPEGTSAGNRETGISLLMDPSAQVGIRPLAGLLNRAPSSVSDVVSRMRSVGLVDDQRRPAVPELFWELAGRWDPLHADIHAIPSPA